MIQNTITMRLLVLLPGVQAKFKMEMKLESALGRQKLASPAHLAYFINVSETMSAHFL